MNSTRNRRKFKMGQGLVEFALVIPVLLLILWGLIEFSRIFQGYLTVQHAAREGARYAVTGQSILIRDDDNIPGNNSPGEVWAARTTSIISKTHEAALGLNIGDFADTPINQWTTNQDSPYYFDVVLNPVSGGDPYGLGGQDMITVTVHYNVPILTPLVKDVLGGVIHVTGQVMMQNEAFDPTPGARYYATLPAGTATATPIGGATATATINFNTPTNTPPVTGTATITPTMTSTPTSTSTPVPPTPTTPAPTSTPTTAVDILTINEPVTEGDTVITGTGTPGNTVILRDFSQTNAPVIGTGTIQPDGTFSINVTSLIAHHVIVGVAGTASDYAIVQPLATATPVPTIAPTATPSATCFT
ncbi:MAG: TadE/TadG family type IV pilus assembly protein, partial [Anaerolineae bacterium]